MPIPNYSCLNGLLAVKDPCGGDNNEAGMLDITSAIAGFNWSSADLTTNEHPQAVQMLRAMRDAVLYDIRYDIQSALISNRFAINPQGNIYTTGTPEYNCNPTPIVPNMGRIKLQMKRGNCANTLQRVTVVSLIIHSKQDYPNGVVLHMQQGNYVTTINVPNIKKGANDVFQLINENNPNAIQDGYVTEIASEHEDLTLWIDPTQYDLYFVSNNCFNCGGYNVALSTYNGYTWATNKGSLAYGLQAKVTIACDYSQIICLIKSSLRGFLNDVIKAKISSVFYEKVSTTDRLNYYTVISQGEAAIKAIEYKEAYEKAFSKLIKALPSALISDNACIRCNGLSLKTNV